MNNKYIPAFNYDFLTPLYDPLVDLLGYGELERRKVVELLNLKAGDKLLDVGCGTGTLLICAKRKYPQVEMFGIDVDPKILNIAKRKTEEVNLKINYAKASSSKLPFADSSFDVIVSSLVFHHLPTETKKQTLSEVRRVLKKDGRFLLADFGKKQCFILNGLDIVTKLLNLPESETLQDNFQGKLPIFLNETGFKYHEVAKRYRGIQFLEAVKQ